MPAHVGKIDMNYVNLGLMKQFVTSMEYWEQIIPCYQESHRKYHNLNHINAMINTAGRNNIGLEKIQLDAIVGHDLVYQPGASDNEEQSAEKYIDICKYLIFFTMVDSTEQANVEKEERYSEIRQIILDTKNHIPTIELSKDVIDLDLFELGTDKYFDNMNLIRQEFGKYTDKDFNTGRMKWLSGMLARDTIFKGFVLTQLPEMETAARNNMINELEKRKGMTK